MQLEAHALKLMAACFNDLKDEESFVRWKRKLSARFLCQFEQQPEGKTLFKSKFSHELGEMKENIFTIVQTMTAYLWSWLWTVQQQDILLIIIEYYRDAFNTNSHYKTCAVLLVVLGIIIFNEINITALVPL